MNIGRYISYAILPSMFTDLFFM